MIKIKCIIVDDEPLSIELLSDYIKKCSFLELIYTSTDPLEALSFTSQNKVELIFLDVQMKELNGLQFIKVLNGNAKVILITAYPDYALQGYEMNVVDYLLKPVLFDRFLQAVQKALQQLLPEINITDDHVKRENEEAIFIKSNYKIIKVWLNDILFIEGKREYVAVHTDQSTILSLQSMKKIEKILSSSLFIRVHKSYIVAINKIDAIEHHRIFIGKKSIPIGETYRPYFYEMLEKKNLFRSD